MPTVKQIRQSMDVKLDTWEAQATALQHQLELSKYQLTENIEMQKYQVELIARRVKDKINATKRCVGDTKNKIKTSFELLQLQLTLGMADTRDGYQAWKKRIQSGIALFEADLDRAIAEGGEALQAELSVLMDDYVREVNVLEAEIDAMQAQFNEDKAHAKADFEKYKQDVQSRINAYKREINEKRKVATNKLGSFETELSAGATKIKDAFHHLFS